MASFLNVTQPGGSIASWKTVRALQVWNWDAGLTFGIYFIILLNSIYLCLISPQSWHWSSNISLIPYFFSPKYLYFLTHFWFPGWEIFAWKIVWGRIKIQFLAVFPMERLIIREAIVVSLQQILWKLMWNLQKKTFKTV